MDPPVQGARMSHCAAPGASRARRRRNPGGAARPAHAGEGHVVTVWCGNPWRRTGSGVSIVSAAEAQRGGVVLVTRPPAVGNHDVEVGPSAPPRPTGEGRSVVEPVAEAATEELDGEDEGVPGPDGAPITGWPGRQARRRQRGGSRSPRPVSRWRACAPVGQRAAAGRRRSGSGCDGSARRSRAGRAAGRTRDHEASIVHQNQRDQGRSVTTSSAVTKRTRSAAGARRWNDQDLSVAERGTRASSGDVHDRRRYRSHGCAGPFQAQARWTACPDGGCAGSRTLAS